uniref:Uncharacterized protein n=1 Tax=Oryza barthii TaxID=65489 RepID=A0A0D3FC51_9ORYZ
MKWFSTISVLPLSGGWAPPAVSRVRHKQHKPDDLVSAIADAFLLRSPPPPPPPLAVAGGFYLSFALLVRPISCIAYDNGLRPRRRRGRGEGGGGRGGGADLGGAGADRQRAAAGACPRGGAAARPPHRPSLDGKLVQEVYIFEA